MSRRNSDSLRDTAQRLSKACAADGEQVDRGDFERVRSGLLAVLFAHFSSLGAAGLCDIADEALARLTAESRRQGRALEKAFAWLSRVATNLAIDELRRAREDELDDETMEDEHPARLVEKLERDDQVKRGLDIAIEKRDEVVVQVVTEYLDLARELDGFPSSRAVAKRCNYSHTTVQEALRRFRDYVE